jgi:hypothetical protein
MRAPLLLVGILLSVSACGAEAPRTSTPSSSNNPSPKTGSALKVAITKCGAGIDNEDMKVYVTDEGHTLIVRGLAGTKRVVRLRCTLKELGATEALKSQIISGSAGTGSAKGYNYTWPANMDSITVTVTD